MSVKVAFSNTYDLNDYTTAYVSEEMYAELEARRGTSAWIPVDPEAADGYYEVYMGPV